MNYCDATIFFCLIESRSESTILATQHKSPLSLLFEEPFLSFHAYALHAFLYRSLLSSYHAVPSHFCIVSHPPSSIPRRNPTMIDIQFLCVDLVTNTTNSNRTPSPLCHTTPEVSTHLFFHPFPSSFTKAQTLHFSFPSAHFLL